MPVPDMQPLFKDWTYCEICEKSYTDDKFVAVVVDNDKIGAENEKRITYICKNCREKCRNDPAFEKSVTEKVFRCNLGRRLKNEKKDKKGGRLYYYAQIVSSVVILILVPIITIPPVSV